MKRLLAAALALALLVGCADEAGGAAEVNASAPAESAASALETSVATAPSGSRASVPEAVPPAEDVEAEGAPAAGAAEPPEAAGAETDTPAAGPPAAGADGSASAGALPEGFSFDGEVRKISTLRYADQVAVGGPYELLELLPALAPAPLDQPGPRLSGLDEVMVTLPDDTKYTYTLYEDAVAVAKSPPGENMGEPVLYRVDPEAYAALKERLLARLEEGLWCPSWLEILRRSRVSGIEFTSSGGGDRTLYTPDSPNFEWAFQALTGISVLPGSFRRAEKGGSLADASLVEGAFTTGVAYRLQASADTLLVEASDMDYACRYALKHAFTVDELDSLAKNKPIPLTGKPVIYLYPEAATEVAVTLGYPGPFTHTDPAYDGGWRVLAQPDGRLVNLADGREYPYLFWEGDVPVDWRFDEGFCVAGRDAEAFLREKLPALGLLPAEYEEFIDYWLPELERNPYNLVTFAGAQYEALAPLAVSPAPDSVLRVHMVYKALQTPVELPEQALRPFRRRGFTVVEWGGSRA